MNSRREWSSDLDLISSGEKQATPWLEVFYYGAGGKGTPPPERNGAAASLKELGLHGLIGSGVEEIDARAISSLSLGETPEGDPIAARVGRYGPYVQVGDTDRRASIADDTVLDELDVDEAMRLLREADMANRVLGIDPATEKNVYIKTGSYGPYVQLGEPELTPKGNIRKGGKPRMASLWPSMSVESITLDQALQLLSYPKSLGPHPEKGGEVVAQDGRFGPYLTLTFTDEEDKEKRDTRSLENHDQLAAITIEKAVELFNQPRKRGRSRQARGPLAVLGESPVTKVPIEVRTGRFGPYVTDGQVNATIPSVRDPMKVTFDDALEFIAAREGRMRDQGIDPRAPKKKGTKRAAKGSGTKKKATKKKAAKKKATKKKAAKKSSKKKAS